MRTRRVVEWFGVLLLGHEWVVRRATCSLVEPEGRTGLSARDGTTGMSLQFYL
jgi:hypothetical protein